MDSFFDMPSGYNDADMEMASLVEQGNLHAKRIRRYGEEGYAKLQAGETISHPCTAKDTGERYSVLVRFDEDGYLIYSVDGERWFNSSFEARHGRTSYGGAGRIA